MGLEPPADAERAGMLERIQPHLSAVPVMWMSPNSHTDAQMARKMLGGISTHRALVAAGMPTAEPYSAAVLAVTGEPDCTGAIAEGVDVRVREKATSGQWHPFHVASVSLSHMKSHLVLLNSHIRSTSPPGRFWLNPCR
jgi:asparagine synthase (glutamine-hydrolysing)